MDVYDFYNQLMRIHYEFFPYLRFGQLINNLEQWLRINKNIDDIFYIENKKILEFLNEFGESYGRKYT